MVEEEKNNGLIWHNIIFPLPFTCLGAITKNQPENPLQPHTEFVMSMQPFLSQVSILFGKDSCLRLLL